MSSQCAILAVVRCRRASLRVASGSLASAGYASREGMGMLWLVLGVWVFGSACFIAGAWWATRPKEPPDQVDHEVPALSPNSRLERRNGEPVQPDARCSTFESGE